MTSKIDKMMMNLGFSKSDVRKVRHRNILYLGIGIMTLLVLIGLALNLGLKPGF